MLNYKIGIACDHAGYALKQTVIAWLKEQGAQVTDYGCPSTDSCDYPDFAHPMAALLRIARTIWVSQSAQQAMVSP